MNRRMADALEIFEAVAPHLLGLDEEGKLKLAMREFNAVPARG